MLLTPIQATKVSQKVYLNLIEFHPIEFQLNPAHTSFLNRIRHTCLMGGTEQSLGNLIQEFRALNPEMRVGIYKSLVARLTYRHSLREREVTWYEFKSVPDPEFPDNPYSYVAEKTALTFKEEEVEKINSVLRALEGCLDLDYVHGYRFTWVPSKNLMITGIAQDYQYQGVSARDYFTFEGPFPRVPLTNEMPIGFIDGDRIILMYYATAEILSNSIARLIIGQNEKGKIIKLILNLIPGTLKHGYYFDGSEGNILHSLVHTLLREHEYGHIVSRRKNPGISQNIENIEPLELGSFAVAQSLSEILADLEGPINLMAETAKSNKALAEKLFWAFFLKTFMSAIKGLDLLGRFDNEFILNYLVSLLIPGTNQPEIDFEKLVKNREPLIQHIYRQVDYLSCLLKQSKKLIPKQREEVKYNVLKSVNPRQQFGEMAINYTGVASIFFERYFSSTS